MLVQLAACVLGVVGLATHYSGAPASSVLVVLSLIAFVIMDVFGVVSGHLKPGCGLFLPLAPALFVRPWPVGLLWGFVAFSAFELASLGVAAIAYRARGRGGDA